MIDFLEELKKALPKQFDEEKAARFMCTEPRVIIAHIKKRELRAGWSGDHYVIDRLDFYEYIKAHRIVDRF